MPLPDKNVNVQVKCWYENRLVVFALVFMLTLMSTVV